MNKDIIIATLSVICILLGILGFGSATKLMGDDAEMRKLKTELTDLETKYADLEAANFLLDDESNSLVELLDICNKEGSEWEGNYLRVKNERNSYKSKMTEALARVTQLEQSLKEVPEPVIAEVVPFSPPQIIEKEVIKEVLVVEVINNNGMYHFGAGVVHFKDGKIVDYMIHGDSLGVQYSVNTNKRLTLGTPSSSRNNEPVTVSFTNPNIKGFTHGKLLNAAGFVMPKYFYSAPNSNGTVDKRKGIERIGITLSVGAGFGKQFVQTDYDQTGNFWQSFSHGATYGIFIGVPILTLRPFEK